MAFFLREHPWFDFFAFVYGTRDGEWCHPASADFLGAGEEHRCRAVVGIRNPDLRWSFLTEARALWTKEVEGAESSWCSETGQNAASIRRNFNLLSHSSLYQQDL